MTTGNGRSQPGSPTGASTWQVKCQAMSERFYGDDSVMPHVREDGGKWWIVGRNASHEFYLGLLPDGTPGRADCGEGMIREGDPDFSREEWDFNHEVYSAPVKRDGRFGPEFWEMREANRKWDLEGLFEDGKRQYWANRWSQYPVEPAELSKLYLGHY